MKKTIRLTESELHNIVKETVMSVLNENIDEYEDWKAQMLHAYKGQKPEKGEYAHMGCHDSDWNALMKARHMAAQKYNSEGESSNGIKYKNTINVDGNSGNINSNEYNHNGERISHAGEVDRRKGIKKTSDYDQQGRDIGYGWYTRGYNDLPINTPEANDFQTQAGNDMIDFYSGNYADRLKQKASQLGNAKSGQDFTPKALKEAVSRAIHKYLR